MQQRIITVTVMQKLLERLANSENLAAEMSPSQFATTCRQICSSGFEPDRKDAKNFLEIFCRFCWELEDEQRPCFELMAELFKRSRGNVKMYLVSALMEHSIVYNDFVFLADELMQSLSISEQEKIKIYPLGWTVDDSFSYITEGEFLYRQLHGMPCFHNDSEKYFRPSCINDFKCFEVMLKMMSISKQPTYLYLRGWH